MHEVDGGSNIIEEDDDVPGSDPTAPAVLSFADLKLYGLCLALALAFGFGFALGAGGSGSLVMRSWSDMLASGKGAGGLEQQGHQLPLS